LRKGFQYREEERKKRQDGADATRALLCKPNSRMSLFALDISRSVSRQAMNSSKMDMTTE